MSDSGTYKPTGESQLHSDLCYPLAFQPGHTTNRSTEHGGLKEDGTPDKRVGTGGMYRFCDFNEALTNCITEFAHGKVDPHEAGQQGGSTSGSGGTESSSNRGSGKGG
jgi:hypothetical protein